VNINGVPAEHPDGLFAFCLNGAHLQLPSVRNGSTCRAGSAGAGQVGSAPREEAIALQRRFTLRSTVIL
jgi:hypothetical protein